jgi:hypothetical protein
MHMPGQQHGESTQRSHKHEAKDLVYYTPVYERDMAGKIYPLGCSAADAMNVGLSEEEHIMLLV